MTKVWPIVSVGVILAATLVSISVGWLTFGEEHPPAPPADPCNIFRNLSRQQGPAASAPGGGGIRVVEQGFSQEATAEGQVFLGAVVVNTSNTIAYQTTVTFHPFDAAHVEVPTNGDRLSVLIPVIMPGQRIGAGYGTYSRSDRVAGAEISLSATTWLPGNALGRTFSPDAATYLRTTRSNPRNPVGAQIRYAETSSNCAGSAVSSGTSVLYRDSTGKLVGGAFGDPASPIEVRNEHAGDPAGEYPSLSSPSCEPGKRETWVVPGAGAPTTADDSRTEIYPYCDPIF